MANIWKVGSRWSDYGKKESSIMSVFRRNNVVFVGGDDGESFLSVKEGDYLAIADGYTIVSVAKAICNAEHIENMTVKWSIKDEERERILGNFEHYAIGVKVRMVDLEDEERIRYKKRSRFCQIKQSKIREKIIDKLENQDKRFSIQSYTCTLLTEQKNKNVNALLESKTKYIIPVYQRPYSWSEEQLEPFINDIFKGFWGIEKNNKNQEPMFIGTMQLSEKKYICENENEQHIIDGQQRLSTLLVLLKISSLQFSENVKIKDILSKFQLETLVTDEQQKYLTQFMCLTTIDNKAEEQNPYIRNARFIFNQINDELENDVFQIDEFINYLTTKVYFVVIETYAGLSKTLQIFNAINTSGLDLNGGDIFKIRMYDYLTSIKGKDEKVFDEISNLYGKIDNYNKELGVFFSINDILSIYQYVIVAKYNLPTVLYHYRTVTFYEQLFDTILKINEWEHFKNNVKDVDLSLNDIEQMIEIRYDWEKKWRKQEIFTAEDICSLHFIWWSRYSKYWLLTFLFLFKFKEWDKMLIFNRQLSKLFFIYSVRFQKLIGGIYYSVMQEIIKTLINKSYEETMSIINEQIGNEKKHNPNWYDLNWFLTENLTENTKRKNLICRLSAMLKENYKTKDTEEIKNITEKLWNIPIDIEHIQSYLDSNEDKRDIILNEWEGNINSLGNLMVLEQDINRSISNSPYQDKIPQYKKSKFKIVKLQADNYPVWSLEKCKERKENEKNKILEYLFNN